MVCLCTEVSVIIKESTEQLTGLIQCNVITFMPKKKKKMTQSHTHTDQNRLRFVSAALEGEDISLLLETTFRKIINYIYMLRNVNQYTYLINRNLYTQKQVGFF